MEREDPIWMESKTDRQDPILPMLVTLKVLPNCVAAEFETVDPKFAFPMTEMVDPSRQKPRTLIVEPKETKSKTEVAPAILK